MKFKNPAIYLQIACGRSTTACTLCVDYLFGKWKTAFLPEQYLH